VGKVASEIRGTALEVRDPAKAMVVLERLARGDSLSRIRREEGVSGATIARMRLAHREALNERKMQAARDAEYMAERYRLLADERVEQLENDPEQLKKVNPKDLALGYGILTDKSAQLRGDATAVVEHKKGYSLEDAMAMIEQARKKVQGEAIDV
jgi:hypothetical protein